MAEVTGLMDRVSYRVPRSVSAGILLLIGGIFTTVNFQQLTGEETLLGTILGGTIPVAISLVIAGIGAWIWVTQWRREAAFRVTAWVLAGIVWMSILGLAVILYELSAGMVPTDVLLLFALFPTYGTVPALLTGWYDIQRWKRRVSLETSNRELAQKQDFIARIEALARVGGWELDLESDAVQWTEGGRQIREIHEGDERSLDDVLSSYAPQDRQLLEQALQDCRAEGIPFEVEVRLTTSRGHIRWVRVRGERVDTGGGQKIRGAIQDITSQKEREQRIMVLNRVLRHNIRNDLTVIAGNAELLAEKLEHLEDLSEMEELEPTVQQAIDEVSAISGDLSEELGKLQELLADLESFEAGTLKTKAEAIQQTSNGMLTLAEKSRRFEQAVDKDNLAGAVELSPIVMDVVETYRERYPSITVDLDLADLEVVGNPDGIRILVDELIENAILHNESTSPRVGVEVSTESADVVALVVEDDGPGIPEVERETLESGEETPLIHGSGIGLWIVHWLASRLDGEVTIETTGPDGSRVAVLLPSASAEREPERVGDSGFGITD